MSVQVLSAAWHVGDGEPEVRIGGQWTTRIELKRLGKAAPEDWHPAVRKADARAAVHLTPIEDVIAGYEFTGTTQIVEAGWTVLRAHGVPFAVPGDFPGAARGRGVFVHDTYFIGDRKLTDALRLELLVERVDWAPSGLDLTHMKGTEGLTGLNSSYDRIEGEPTSSGNFIITGTPV